MYDERTKQKQYIAWRFKNDSIEDLYIFYYYKIIAYINPRIIKK